MNQETCYDDKMLRVLGFSPDKFRLIDRYLQKSVDTAVVPGVTIGLVRADNPPLFLSYGVRSLEHQQTLTADSIYRIASLTKPVISVAMLILRNRGLCQFQDPVSQYFPEIKKMKLLTGESLQTPMTLLHLLTHTAGFGYDFNVPANARSAYSRLGFSAAHKNTRDFALWMAKLPLLFEPGSSWHYGYSTDLLGYLIELISGQQLDVFLEQNIFSPLKMLDTGFYLSEQKRDRYVSLYKAGHQGALELLESAESSSVFSSKTVLSGGGGLLSSPVDYLKFVKMLTNYGEYTVNSTLRQLIGEDTIEELSKNYLSPDLIPFNIGIGIDYDTEGYGFGYNVKTLMNPGVKKYPVAEGEYGWAGSNNTYFWIDQRKEFGMVLFTHIAPFAWYPLEQEVKRLTYGALI